jgi:calcineurin-like phosphoesterase
MKFAPNFGDYLHEMVFNRHAQRFEVAKNRVLLHGAVIEIDDATGKAVKIQRVAEKLL